MVIQHRYILTPASDEYAPSVCPIRESSGKRYDPLHQMAASQGRPTVLGTHVEPWIFEDARNAFARGLIEVVIMSLRCSGPELAVCEMSEWACSEEDGPMTGRCGDECRAECVGA